MKNLIFWENGYLQFELRPVEFYNNPFSIDSFGNITKRPRTKTNSASIDLKSGYTFLGEHLGKALELRRVSLFYLSRSDGFYFTALKWVPVHDYDTLSLTVKWKITGQIYFITALHLMAEFNFMK